MSTLARGVMVGKNEPVDFLNFVATQTCGWRRRASGRLDALTGDVVLESVKRTDEPSFPQNPTRLGAEIRSQMGTERICDTNLAGLITPSDDLLPHPFL